MRVDVRLNSRGVDRLSRLGLGLELELELELELGSHTRARAHLVSGGGLAVLLFHGVVIVEVLRDLVRVHPLGSGLRLETVCAIYKNV